MHSRGRDMNFFMPPQVYEYIERNKLYKNDGKQYGIE